MNKQVNREKKFGFKWKPVNIDYFMEHAMYESKQSTKELISRHNLALEANSWLCNFIFYKFHIIINFNIIS